MTQVSFFKIRTNQEKLDFIIKKAQLSIDLEKRLLILVDSDEAAHYIDTLLWRYPKDSFIPHQISQKETPEWIAICVGESTNLNHSSTLLNLRASPTNLYNEIFEVIEIFDETSLPKIEQSKNKFDYYKGLGSKIKLSLF